MGFVIITRNPRSKKALAITEGTNEFDEHMSEFETEDKAIEAAESTTACRAWGYQIVEID